MYRTIFNQKYPSGRVVKNVLDNDGDLAIVQSKKNANAGYFNYADSFRYTAAGAVSSMQLGNGKWESTSFNSRLQPTQIALGTVQSGTDKLKLDFTYYTPGLTNNNGNVQSQTITVPTEVRNNITYNGFTANQGYVYDSLNRIKKATETVSGQSRNNSQQTFQYDRFGNRTFDAANTTTLLQSNNITNPTIDIATNRFSSGQNYVYDKNGNLTNDAEGRQFVYDAENHQKEVKNSANQTLGLYEYDGEGRRVRKISSTETTIFVYNAAGTLVAEYSTQMAQTQQVSYLTQDHLGSPRVITNESGAVTSRQDFSAFGEETLTAQRTQGLGYKPDSIRQDYTGYQKDEESGGLEFAQARYYNTKHGRFTSIDPLTASANIKNPQTFNRYSYVLNSPYKFTDPLGLISEMTGACGSRCSNSGAGGGGMVSTYGNAFQDISGTEFSTQLQTTQRTLYIHVGFTDKEMSLNETDADGNKKQSATISRDDFKGLKKLGEKNGINVVFIDGSGIGEGTSEVDQFIQALQDPNSVGVVFVGHTASFDPGVTPAVGINIGRFSPESIQGVSMTSIEGIKAPLIALFGCDTANIALDFQGRNNSNFPAIIALESGVDGVSSVVGIAEAGYAAARAIINGANPDGVTLQSNNKFSEIKKLKYQKDGKQIDNDGDFVGRVQ